MASLIEVALRHAEVETAGDLEATMKTLVAEPIYEFFPIGLRMVGPALVRRYYEHLIQNFLPRVQTTELVGEFTGEQGVAQEYDVLVDVEGLGAGGTGIERHRIVGVLYGEGDLLTGERIYGSDRALRLLLGPVIDELESLGS